MTWQSAALIATLGHAWGNRPIIRLAMIVETIILLIAAICALLASPFLWAAVGITAVTMCGIFHLLYGQHGLEFRLALGAFFGWGFGQFFFGDMALAPTISPVGTIEYLFTYIMIVVGILLICTLIRAYETGRG